MVFERRKMARWFGPAGVVSAILAFALAAALIPYGPAPGVAGTADDAFLERMAGEWRGDGRVRERAGDARERVSCRMTASWSSSSGRLSMDFDCRGTDFEFSSSGFLNSLDRNSYISGLWRAGSYGQASVSGRRTGNLLSLELSSQDSRTGEEVLNSLSMQLSGDGSRLVNIITSEDRETRQRFTVLTLTLRK